MISLLNRFSLVGILKECRIDLFPSHIKAKFNIEVDNQNEITVYYSINKKFHSDKYKEFIELIPQFHPTIKGYVWNGKERYYTISSDNLLEKQINKLFISGNILERNGNVYLNGEYIKITKLKNEFSFSFEGIIIDNNHILNIVNDSPRVFNIKNNLSASEKIYNFSVKYNFGYKIENLNVFNEDKDLNFKIIKKSKTNKTIEQKDIDNYMLEWEIINSDKEV